MLSGLPELINVWLASKEPPLENPLMGKNNSFHFSGYLLGVCHGLSLWKFHNKWYLTILQAPQTQYILNPMENPVPPPAPAHIHNVACLPFLGCWRAWHAWLISFLPCCTPKWSPVPPGSAWKIFPAFIFSFSGTFPAMIITSHCLYGGPHASSSWLISSFIHETTA